MKIILSEDSSVINAPLGFTGALTFAAQQLDQMITNNITITIDVSWDSSANPVFGEGGPENMQRYSYGTVLAALKSHAASPAAITAAADMPATDPTGGNGVILSEAQAEALGLMSSSALPDGVVIFGDPSGVVLNFSTSNLAIPGEQDFLGVALHELSHALGRSGWGDGSAKTGAYAGLYSLMDLYRFSSAGVLETSANPDAATSPAAYFSINNGITDLAQFATSSDYYDWSSTVSADSFDALAYPDTANTLSAVDQTLMSALGFDVACFCPGTRIATGCGALPVEQLAIGDEVMTPDGLRRIKWIGRSAYEGRFLGSNPLMLPVTFAPGALGDGIPSRPLTVSPGHGVFMGDVLVPAWRLVNGVNVTQGPRTEPVSYIHLELDRHGLLLSEGCWSESYFNETPRSWFQNAAEYFQLYPGDDVCGTPCLPRIEDGIMLQALQHHVNHRAGLPLVAEPDGDLQGEVEITGPGICAGWAYAGEAPVTLLVMRGGEILARVVANRYRADLRVRGLGKGCHGFAVALPEGFAGEIMVRRALDGAVLALVEAAQAA